MASAKNFALSPGAQDLGLGDQLKQQLDDAEEERRKKLMQQANQLQGGPLMMGTQTLFPGAM